VTLAEVNESLTIIQSAAHEDANIIFGAVHDEKMKDEVKITVIATGFKSMPQRAHAAVGTAATIANMRTASAFVPATPPRPHPTYQAAAPPAPAPVTRQEAQTLEAVKSSVKGNYSQDDLDVPAFLRKKGEMQ
jgi:cell division protein FtsZ